jgi:anion-transporting  ArsA/GET3 family ATPase
MFGALDLAGDQLVICLGPGGVGKTTVGAALALKAAIDGRAVDVMTIDPAPRLLDALGLDSYPAVPHEVPLTGLNARRGGRLRALRLDPKRMFDALVERYAPSTAARDAILANRIYLGLSGALAGLADYMAAEQLVELRRQGGSDLIVLDTPPAHDAIEFLDAPRRMLELLSSRALALLGASRGMMRGPLGIFDFAARAVLAAFDRLTRLHLLVDVQAFVRSFDGMYAGFAERAAEAQALIREPTSRIVLVSTAEPQRVEQSAEFVASLSQLGLRVGAMVVNRVMPTLPDARQIEETGLSPALRRKLRRNLSDFGALKAREAAWLEALNQLRPPPAPMVVAADLGYEPTTLRDLVKVAKSLRAVD